MPTEAELGIRFGVSRAVIREAVKILSSKGLIATRRPLGTWVQPESDWNMLDPDVLSWLLERRSSTALLLQFTEFRMVIEPGAASLAARTAGDAERAAIRLALARMRSAQWGDDDPLESDIAFHVALLRASGNVFYTQLAPFIASALRVSIRVTYRSPDVHLDSIEDHAKVANAVLARKPTAAATAMRALIQKVMHLIPQRQRLPGARGSPVLRPRSPQAVDLI